MKRRKPLVIEAENGNVTSTVKIYTRAKAVGESEYKVFEVCDYSTGKRVLRSFSDKDKAIKEAERIARFLAAGDARAAQMRSPDVGIYGRATEMVKPTGVPLEIVAAHFAEAFQILGSDRIVEAAKFLKQHDPDNITQRTVAEVVAEVIAARESRGASKRYVEDLRSRLNRFAKDFAVDVSSISTADVQRWFDKLKLSAQTVKNFRTVLGTLFNFAEARGYITRGTNPIEGTERVSGRNGGKVEIFSPEEIDKLLDAAPDRFKVCIALGAFAGLRSAEIERLAWSDIDLQSKHVHVAAEKAKTASRRLVPILPNLKEWLLSCPKRSGSIWTGDHEEFYDDMQATAAGAKVKWKANGLRHSFISYRLAVVQNAAQVALEAGNSAAVVFAHYRELVKPKAAKKWFSVSPEKPANITTMEAANG